MLFSPCLTAWSAFLFFLYFFFFYSPSLYPQILSADPRTQNFFWQLCCCVAYLFPPLLHFLHWVCKLILRELLNLLFIFSNAIQYLEAEHKDKSLYVYCKGSPLVFVSHLFFFTDFNKQNLLYQKIYVVGCYYLFYYLSYLGEKIL